MTDESVPEPPAPDPTGMDGDQPYEDELDALLAAATSLATEVAEDVGTPQESPPRDDADTADIPSDDVDSKLAAVDGLMEQTSRELGTDAGDVGPDVAAPKSMPSAAAAGAATEASSESTAEMSEEEETGATLGSPPDAFAEPRATPPAIPDFMDEFTRPEGESVSDSVQAEQTAEPATDSSSIPDFMSEFTEPEDDEFHGSVRSTPSKAKPAETDIPDFMAEFTGSNDQQKSGGPAAKTETTPAGLEQESATEEQTFEGLDDKESVSQPGLAGPGFVARFARQITTRLVPVAILACEGGIRVLETIDKPTQRLGDKVRSIVGWVAIATIGTSLLVYIVSLF